MAIYHCHITSYRRSCGASATGGLAYRRGLRARCQISRKKYDFRKKSEVAFSEFIPAVNDPTDYGKLENLYRHYQAVEKSERHCLATLGREVEVALPIEFSLPQQVELVREFVAELRKQLGLSATYCDYSIHSKAGNPHCHICFREREQVAPFEFSRKKRRDWDGVEFVRKCRTVWEEKTNLALGRAGVNQHVYASSHADRGLSIQPSLHHGRGHYIKESEIRRMNKSINQYNQKVSSLSSTVSGQVKRQLSDDYGISQVECMDLPSSKPFVQLLYEQQYGIVPGFAGLVSSVDMKQAPKSAIVFFADKSKMLDWGNRVEIRGCVPEASAERLIMLAKAKGWRDIVFTGDEAFLRLAFAMAIAERINVIAQNAEQLKLLIEIRQNLRVDFVPPPNAQAIARAREMEEKGFNPDAVEVDGVLVLSPGGLVAKLSSLGGSGEAKPAEVSKRRQYKA